jgi:subtilisin family serine protease
MLCTGNSDGDSCALSPANVDATLTVAASSDDDSVWPNSNTGRCVDIFAPGDKVGGASIAGDHSFSVWSGTSMSVPHVAGMTPSLSHLPY